jgi:hypothetical protein
LLITSVAGYLLTGRVSLYQNQVEGRRDSPVHVNEYVREVVERRGTLLGEVERRGTLLGETGPELGTPNPSTTTITNPVPDLLDLISGESLAVSDEDSDRLYRLAVPEPWIGSSVRMLEWPQNSLLVAVVRQGRIEVPRGDTVLVGGDDLVVMATPEAYARLAGREGSFEAGKPEPEASELASGQAESGQAAHLVEIPVRQDI